MMLAACGAPGQDTGALEGAATTDLNFQWQPFTSTSSWNMKLPASRSETPLTAQALATGAFDPSDAEYGIKVYFASASDPTLSISYSDYNSWTDSFSNPNPIKIQGPANMAAPTGSDGTVILVDANRHYAYEMWQFKNSGGNAGHSTSINVVDLTSSGVHRNVGITAAGLPGSGGLLKSYELAHGLPIQHKMWLAVNPAMLYASSTAPAASQDGHGNGKYAQMHYGDVLALSQSFNVSTSECNLSPFTQRIAQGMKDYGGIVVDIGGDAVSIVAEVGSIKNYIDVDYNSTMWTEFACLAKHLVVVNNPFTGATPGGLGIGGTGGGTGTGTGSTGTGTGTGSTGTGTGTGSSGSGTGGTTNPELVTNPGFESATAPWSLLTWDGTSQVTRSSALSHGGKYSVQVHNPNQSSDGAVMLYSIPVTAGNSYQFSAWMALQSVTWGTAELMLDWNDATGKTLKTIESIGKSASATWAQEVLSGTAPAGATQAVLYLFSYATGNVFYDDISFKQK